jgi:hypothetical protein
MHTPPDVNQKNGVTYVNIPTLMSDYGGNDLLDTGFQVEAYGDKVVLRARNYYMHEWLPAHEYVVGL